MPLVSNKQTMNIPDSPQYSASSSQSSELRSQSVSPSSRFLSAPGRLRVGSGSDCPYPVNFKKEYGIDGGNGCLYFRYSWQSSTGNLADLEGCIVGEKVTYNGGNPYNPPNPPCDHWNLNNPTIINEKGSEGKILDEHGYKNFITPYTSIAFDSTQIYRYHTPCMNPDEYITLLGPLKIYRMVLKEGDSWFYRVTKDNVTASMKLPETSVHQLNQIRDIETIIKNLKIITIGTTRKELLKYFIPSGGIFVPPVETFIYRWNEHIRVDVEFSSGVIRPSNLNFLDDKIIGISKYYLDPNHSSID